ncbi:hypothetical protein B0A48_15378 [Cryoendolithus antarcticus]|uniref:Rhodopsin domain-containing protein n=1 Tax=Cryoendolithus antarcticus TaxID=1507870 RepID=A0A1V8SHU9_9PEZI|nr:hypothetical protein B0A48_15378 [Cryoendolithus antarcticus]
MAENMQPRVLAAVVVFPILSTVSVAARVATRLWMKQFYWDDTLCLIGWAFAVSYAVVEYIWIKMNWFGYHVVDIPKLSLEETILATKYSLAQQVLYNPVLGLVKASMVVFFLRLGDRRKAIKWTLLVFGAINIGHMISVFIAALFQCIPVSAYWNRYRPVPPDDFQCIDEKAFSLVTAGLAILTDVVVLLIPMAMLWNLQLNLRRKVIVGIALSLGWVVTIISAIRFKVFYNFWMGLDNDGTYGYNQVISGIEINVALITCCAPALKAMITLFMPRFFGTVDGSRKHGNVSYSREAYAMQNRSQSKTKPHSRRENVSGLYGRDDDAESQEAIVNTGQSLNGGPSR